MNPARRAAQLAPYVVGNTLLPHFPHPRQMLFLGAHHDHDERTGPFECLFGGAAGGGKSDALLMAGAQFAGYPHFRGLILRRTHQELAKAGAIMERAIRWWSRTCSWNGTTKRMTFPSGATLEFGYHAHPTDDGQYQGGEWHYVGFDELTHWPDEGAWEWLKSRLRRGDGDPIPLRLLGGSNPGSAGHDWVKRRFIGGIDPTTGAHVPPVSRFIPSRIEDNPSLDQAAYIASLSQMHPTRRAQLLEGDWGARDPGDYFRAEWFGVLLDENPPEVDAIRWWDLAASESKDAARTAGVRMARCALGARVVTHAVAFRLTPGARDARIEQTAMADGKRTTVGLEIEGGSGGVAQFEALALRLRAKGFRVVGARPRAEHPLTDRESGLLLRNPVQLRGKAARADPVASCLERGFQRRGECPDNGAPYWGADAGQPVTHQRDGIRLVAGPWVQNYIDELEGFTGDDRGAKLCDLVDATSGAWAWLEAHPVGVRFAPATVNASKAVGEQHNTHPEDRADDLAPGRDRAGHWRP